MSEESNVNLLPELKAERDTIDHSFVRSKELLNKAIDELETPAVVEAPAVVETPAVVKPETPEFQMYDVMSNSSKRIEVCIKIPAEEHPNVNFVGRLIGPGGATLKAIQEMTSTRIAILGKGSQRDKKKCEELAQSGDPKWAHMLNPLHVKISAYSHITEAYGRVDMAIKEITKLLQVIDEENSISPANAQPAARGGHMAPRGMGRGGRGGRGGVRGGRVAPAQARSPFMHSHSRNMSMEAGRSGSRGASVARLRGNGSVRGSGRAAASSRPVSGRYQQKMPAAAVPVYEQGYGYEAAYEDQSMYEGYGAEYADPSAYGQEAYATEQQGYMMSDQGLYGAEGHYDMSYSAYGVSDGYADSYGNGAGDQQYAAAPAKSAYRGKAQRGGHSSGARGGRSQGKPY